MHTFICRQGLITYNWAVTEVASIQCGLMIFSTNMVTALKLTVSEVGFEPTPTEVDCDLNAAP